MNSEPIVPSDWTTSSEAARLLGCSPQRVNQMTEEGSLEVLRPWPRVTLIGRRSIAEWLAGHRQSRIGIGFCRRHLLEQAGLRDIHDLDINVMRDQLRELIAAERPRWDNERADLWALNMASRLHANPRPN